MIPAADAVALAADALHTACPCQPPETRAEPEAARVMALRFLALGAREVTP